MLLISKSFRQAARYLHWTYTSEAAADIAHHLSYIPMRGILLDRAVEALKSLSCKTPEKNVTLWGQSVCDAGCIFGSCRFNFSFQPATEGCKCDLGFKNQEFLNCSEEVETMIMDTTKPLALFMVILTSLMIAVTTVVAGLVIKFRNNHIIKAASPLFCTLALSGVLLTYLDVYLYIGQPSDAVCAFRPVIISFASSIFFGTMLPKTFRIYKVFRRIRAFRSSINNRRLLLQSSAIIFLNLLLIIIWFSIDIPKPRLISGTEEKTFICASDNPTVNMAFNDIMLVYHGLLVAATTFLAFKVRVAQGVFNEAVSIGVSVYGVTTVAIFFVPVSFISSINTQTFFLLRTLASIICATTVLFALFVPKIIAILRPVNLQGKPSEMALSTSTSKKASQLGHNSISVQTVAQSEYYVCHFNFKKNGLFSVWKSVAISVFGFTESPGSGFLLFHDSSDTSETFQTLRIQDTKLIFEGNLRNSSHSTEKPLGANSETGQLSNGESMSVPCIARLIFADGYYDLEGKSPVAMATLLKVFAVSPALSTRGPKLSDVTSNSNVRNGSTAPKI
ncbi:7 transmembrane sweet-taste receptor of 3 GCPR-domain-containing protein [Paraphysoderma sedebokerense]|nr:7 transmembrane sweet-taste receptor of 3 GCPR-domain-containing protein [Paraphysoderma sedebokerense]